VALHDLGSGCLLRSFVCRVRERVPADAAPLSDGVSSASDASSVDDHAGNFTPLPGRVLPQYSVEVSALLLSDVRLLSGCARAISPWSQSDIMAALTDICDTFVCTSCLFWKSFKRSGACTSRASSHEFSDDG
jgi:hypothetical protein